jgi:hypothetical protein
MRLASNCKAKSLIAALLFLSILTACGGKSSDYDRMCKIYEEYGAEKPSDVLAVKIAQRVEREIPEIYESYGIVLQNSPQYRYEDFKELARTRANQPNWTCEAFRKFHEAPAHSP